MLTAIVLVDCDVHAIPETAQALADLEHVSEVYSVTGRVDLVVLVRAPGLDELAEVVTHEVARVEGVTATETLLAFRAYSRHDLEALFTLGT